MNATADQLQIPAADLYIGLGNEITTKDGRTGTVNGWFPPEQELEIVRWVDEPYECLDGRHVPACSGTVLHTHPRQRVFEPVSWFDVAAINGNPVEVTR